MKMELPKKGQIRDLSHLDLKQAEDFSMEPFVKEEEVVVSNPKKALKTHKRGVVVRSWLGKIVNVPDFLRGNSLDRKRLPRIEVILERFDSYINDPTLKAEVFTKMVTFLFDEANADKQKVDEDNGEKSLSEISQPDMVNTVLQLIKFMNEDNLNVCFKAIEHALMVNRSNNAIIINQ